MSDSLESGSEEVSVSEADVFYSDAEPVEPTALAEEEEAATEPEGETSEAEAVAESESHEEPEDDGEVEVFDKPNDFVKYEYDDESELYEFKSMGKKVKVNTDTLINNFQGSQKLNVELENLAKAKKGEFDGAKASELDTLREETTKYQALSQKLEGLITETDEQIDWEHLREYDTPEYLKQKELQLTRKEALDKSSQEQAVKTQERQTQVRNAEADKLKQAVPEWTDAKVMTEEAAEIRDHSFTRGFTQEEINHLYDHRFWLLMKDSKELAQIKAKKITEVKTLPTPVKSKRTPMTKDVDKSAADIFYG